MINICNVEEKGKIERRAQRRYKRSARHRPSISGNNYRCSDIVTTCPQKKQKSDALIAYALSHAISHSYPAYHRLWRRWRWWWLPAEGCGVAKLRRCGAPRFLLRKSGNGDSDMSDSNHIKHLWIVALVGWMGHRWRRAMADKD